MKRSMKPKTKRSLMVAVSCREKFGVAFVASVALILFYGASAQEKNSESGTTQPVSFSRDIAPIFLKKCMTCHGPEKAKGKFQLHTFELLMKGGESKELAIVSAKPQQSKLFQLITAQDEDD